MGTDLKCSGCGEEKAPEKFYAEKRAPTGRRRICIECSKKDCKARYQDPVFRWRHFDSLLRSQYKIDSEDWARAFEKQGGKCPGCQNQLLFDSSTHVDHDHVTKKFRGLLCRHCNLLLGYSKDIHSTLGRLMGYLDGL